MPSKPKRRLAAIMFTDMVGYTALMQNDEPKARELIERHREILTPLVKKHDGEVLQYIGDGTFCIFNSAIESVNCAIEIQRALVDENEINLRIGIHVGDVVSKGEDIYGDGVNVASRLEPLAEPGGVCISGRVYDDIRNQPDMEAEYLGEKELKNVGHLMKIYSLTGEGLAVTTAFKEENRSTDLSDGSILKNVLAKSLKKSIPWIAGAAVLFIFLNIMGWLPEEFSITKVTAEENSLAIMFIENMMDPSDSERYAEMIKELLITDLSQSSELRVIGGQRLFDIAKRIRKEEDVVIDRANASEIAREAGARWMLVGKLSVVGTKMVLTTQIEGVRDGKIVDSQRSDSEDFFALVDMLTEEIKDDLGFVSDPEEIDAPVKEITTYSPEAYQLYLDGLEFLNESNFKDAIGKFSNALEIDSTFNKALYKLAVAQWWSNGRAFKETVKRMLINEERYTEDELLLVKGLEAIAQRNYSQAQETYQQLLLKYPDDKEIHYGMGEAYFHSGKKDRLKALAAFEDALILDPEYTLAYRHVFDIYNLEKMYVRGIRKAKELVALHPERSSGYKELGRMYMNNGEFDLAIESYRTVLDLDPNDIQTKSNISWTYHLMGNYTKTEEIINEVLLTDITNRARLDAYYFLALAYAEQGKFREGTEILKRTRKFTQQIRIDLEASTLFTMAFFSLRRDDPASAIGFIDSALALGPSARGVIIAKLAKGIIYANSKDQIALENSMNDLQELLNKDDYGQYFQNTYNLLKIEKYHLSGDIDSALSEFHNIRDSKDWVDWSLYRKAVLYLEKKDFEQSLTVTLAMQAPDITRDYRSFNYPYAFYVRGMVYEEMGKPELAIENYEALLELWKDADEQIPERRDTIKRLASLKKGS